MPEDFTQNWPLNWQRLHLNNLRWRKIMFPEVGCCNKCDSAAQLLGEISCLLTQRKVWFITAACIWFWLFIISRLSQKASDGLTSQTAVEQELKCYPRLRFALYISGGLKRLRDQFEIPPPPPHRRVILFELRQTRRRQSTALTRADTPAGKLRGSDSGRPAPWED